MGHKFSHNIPNTLYGFSLFFFFFRESRRFRKSWRRTRPPRFCGPRATAGRPQSVRSADPRVTPAENVPTVRFRLCCGIRIWRISPAPANLFKQIEPPKVIASVSRCWAFPWSWGGRWLRTASQECHILHHSLNPWWNLLVAFLSRLLLWKV